MSATCSASWEPLAARRRLAGHAPSHCSNQIPPNRPPSSAENYSLWHTFDACGKARVLLCFPREQERCSAEEETHAVPHSCPGTPESDLSRPLWGTLHRAAGGWRHAALGDAPGSGRALWGTLTAHPAWAGAALAGNERGTRRRGVVPTRLKKPVFFLRKTKGGV